MKNLFRHFLANCSKLLAAAGQAELRKWGYDDSQIDPYFFISIRALTLKTPSHWPYSTYSGTRL